MAVLLPRAGQADIAWFVDQPAPQPAVPAAPARVRLCNRMAGRWLLRFGGGPPGRGGKGGTFRAVTEEAKCCRYTLPNFVLFLFIDRKY